MKQLIHLRPKSFPARFFAFSRPAIPESTWRGKKVKTMNPLIQRQKTNPLGLFAPAYFRSNFGLNMLCAVCIVLISRSVWATEPSYGDCLQQGGTPEFDETGRYVHCRSGVGPRPNPRPHPPRALAKEHCCVREPRLFQIVAAVYINRTLPSAERKV
jgi:hypothetical protein